jgi:hypothetical protein
MSSKLSPFQFLVQQELTTLQFTPPYDKESRVQKTEVKIHLPGRAVQNTEIESLVYVL